MKKKLIITPATALAAGALMFGASPALASDTTNTTDESTQTAAASQSENPFSLDHPSITADAFANPYKGQYLRTQSAPAGTHYTIEVDGPQDENLVYETEATASPTGRALVQIHAPYGADEESANEWVGSYTVTVTADDGESFEQSFEVTPFETNPPEFTH